MRQLLSKKCIWVQLRTWLEDDDLVSSSSKSGMMDCGDMPGPTYPHSTSEVTIYSEMACEYLCVYVCVFALVPCFAPHVSHGSNFLECVCASVSMYERLDSREEADQAWRISSVTAHQD